MKTTADCTPSTVHTDPEIVHGEPVFIGTRVFVSCLFDNLAAGMTLEQIQYSYPSLTREVIEAAIHEAGHLLEDHARSAR